MKVSQLTADDVEIYIDSEFKARLPAQSEQEREEMIREIEHAGRFVGTICCWRDGKGALTLLDGHHRYDYWLGRREETPIGPPVVEEILLPEREAALDWMDSHALAGRNLNSKQASAIRGRRYNRKKPAAHRPKKGGQIAPLSDEGEKGGQTAPLSAATVADETGVSEDTIKRDGQYAAALDVIRKVNGKAATDLESGDLKLSKSDTIKMAALEPADISHCLKNLRYGSKWNEGLDNGAPEKTPQPEQPKDTAGRVIPEGLRDVFGVSRSASSMLNSAARYINEVLKLDIPTMPQSAVKVALKDLKAAVKAGLAHAVCPYCKGRGCQHCGQHGYVTKDQWDGIPEERRK